MNTERHSRNQKNSHHGATETLRKTESRTKREHTEGAEATEARGARRPRRPGSLSSGKSPWRANSRNQNKTGVKSLQRAKISNISSTERRFSGCDPVRIVSNREEYSTYEYRRQAAETR